VAELEAKFFELITPAKGDGLPAPTKAEFEGVGYEVRQLPDKGPALCTARLGTRFVITLDEKSLQDVIVRSNTKPPADETVKLLPSLAETARFKAGLARAPQNHIALGYLDGEKLAKIVEPFMAAAGNPAAMKQFAAMKGVVWTSAVVKGRVIDSIFISSPAAERGDLWDGVMPLQYRTLKATGTQTALYLGNAADIPRVFEQVKKQVAESGTPQRQFGRPFPDPWAEVSKLNQKLKAQGIDLKQGLIANLGNEYALIMDKTEGMIPQVAAIVEVKNAEPVKATLDKLIALDFDKLEPRAANPEAVNPDAAPPVKKSSQPEFTSEPFDEGTLYRLKLPADNPAVFMGVSPSLYLGRGHLVLSISDKELKTILARLKEEHPTLDAVVGYREAVARMPANPNSVLYFDLRDLVESYYPLAMMGMAAQSRNKPGSGPDFSKMPTSATINKYLTPVVSGSVVTPEGMEWKMESPAGVGLAVAGIGAAVAIPAFTQARTNAHRVACMNNLRQIESAKASAALEKGWQDGQQVGAEDITPFLRGGQLPECPLLGAYSIGVVGEKPACSIHGTAETR
jgi:hypothetical protein